MFLDPARSLYSRYFDWYEGTDRTLFTAVQPTIINGLSLLKPQHISTRFNFFSALSRFYSAAVIADMPRLPLPQQRMLIRAAEHWSITGEAVLVGGPGRERAVRPDLVFPVHDPFDVETVRRFLFVYPERKTQEGDWTAEPQSAGRARVVDYDVETGEAFESIRVWSAGEIADTPRGRPVDIGRVAWIRTSHAPYKTVESVIREITIRLNMLQLALNTTSVPLIQLDKDQVADGQLKGGATTAELLSSIITTSPLGLTTAPPFGGEEGARYVERSGAGLAESIEYVRLLLGQLGVLSGVPDYVFGIQLGRPSDETERVLFAGRARINAFRNELSSAWEELGLEALDFPSEPFITISQQTSRVQGLVQDGIITVSEARSVLGYGNSPTT